MATFQEQIEGMTSISTGTTPTTEELDTFLTDGAKDLINKIIVARPDEAYKFGTDNSASNSDGIEVKGQLLSAVRENGNSTDVRPATPIPNGMRYLVTDYESIYYRTKYNPCYYLMNGKIFILPVPTDSNNRAIVSQINYPTVGYADTAISSFPDEYEYLVIYYASAMTALVAASEIQNNMPTVPTAPEAPNFEFSDVSLPNLPIFSATSLDINFKDVNNAINREDIELTEKYFTKIDKELDIHKEVMSESDKSYQEELKIFERDLERLTKNRDRSIQIEVGEYRAQIYKYQYEISSYSQELTSKLAKYKWYMEQYIRCMNMYVSGITSLARPQEGTKGDVQVRPPREREEREEG